MKKQPTGYPHDLWYSNTRCMHIEISTLEPHRAVVKVYYTIHNGEAGKSNDVVYNHCFPIEMLLRRKSIRLDFTTAVHLTTTKFDALPAKVIDIFAENIAIRLFAACRLHFQDQTG